MSTYRVKELLSSLDDVVDAMVKDRERATIRAEIAEKLLRELCEAMPFAATRDDVLDMGRATLKALDNGSNKAVLRLTQRRQA